MFILHEPFYKTLKGHGTNLALLAGILGIKPDDERLRDAFEIAEDLGIEYSFSGLDLGDVHPNTVKICLFSTDDSRLDIIGSSIGGSKIIISKIDDTDVEFDGEYATLITKHIDRSGVIAKISNVLSKHNINIAFMKVFRHERGVNASLIIQVDDVVDEEIMVDIGNITDIIDAVFCADVINRMGNQKKDGKYDIRKSKKS